MIMENKVSLWLGNYINAEELNSYINIHYDEDGNTIPSKFQIDFDIEKYDTDAIESDWISEPCESVDKLLAGFSGDLEIIAKFKPILKNVDLRRYNSILLLYNFEYSERDLIGTGMDFIGTVDLEML